MTDVDIPTDERPSRIDRRRGPVSDYDNPDDPTTVDAKIAEFYATYSHPTIETDIVSVLGEPARFIVKASVWTEHRAVDDIVRPPDATAHGSRVEGESEFPALESAESVAIGRALRFLGITGNPD